MALMLKVVVLHLSELQMLNAIHPLMQGDKDDREFIASVVPILSCNKSTSYAKSWNAR